MQVAVTDANARLTELIRCAEAGEEVILTRHGRAVARVVPVARPADRTARRRLLEAVRSAGGAKARARGGAARSQDFLYGPDGLPQ
ncbi:MAG: type II toxin-antitoxin system Phd/YefM family antitoxin [Stellaceae bacterium]